jgi:hypothetical protein
MFSEINKIIDNHDLADDVALLLKTEINTFLSNRLEFNGSELTKQLLIKEIEINNLRKRLKNARGR